MHLYLKFEDGKISGEGTDYVGPWVANGAYDESSGKCDWTKQYVGQHSVKYQGVCNENGIQGNWTIYTTGPFHIWPRTHGHLNELYLREELEMSDQFGPSTILEPAFNPDSNDELV